MKLVYLLSAALLLGAGSVSAQSKIDTRGRQLLDHYKSGQLSLRDSQALLATPMTRSSAAMADVLVETTDGAVLDSLEACGYAVEYISPSFSLVCMPVDDIESLAESPAVSTLSFGHECEPMMDDARAASNVNGVHSGLGIKYKGDSRHSFRGDGVIVGMFDTGFDPGHVNFLDADGKECRIKYYARFSGSSTTPSIYEGDKVRTAPTDDSEETHGTHVAGIMGGAYNGVGTYYKKDANSSMVSNAGTIPLYGVAPNADLAICAGELYNNTILAGIRRLINYANSQGKPIAINLSLGHNNGPHDGTDSFSRALDELAKEAIICVAAGNEGGDNIHAGTTFTADKKSIKVAYAGNRMAAGLVDVWSTTSAEIKVSVILTNAAGDIAAKITSENGRTVNVGVGDGEDQSIFRNAFDGTIALTAQRDGNRYNVSVRANSDIKSKAGSYTLGLMVEGEEGARVDVYGSRTCGFTANAPAGFDRPDNNGSISGLACGFNTIIVGAYSSRSQYVDLSGTVRSTGGGSGNLASYSSWGELIDGRKLPHITAPGTGLISSYSGYYARPNYDGLRYMLCAVTEEGGQKHYWGSMNGTSMATPYVTGSVGLWLEADPDLTAAKARDIMISTAKRDASMDGVTAWGAGKIQVLNGIKEVIAQMDNNAVEDVTTDESKVLVCTDGLSVELVSPVQEFTAELFNIGGQKVAAVNGRNGNACLEAPSAGIYIVNVRAGSTNHTSKVALH